MPIFIANVSQLVGSGKPGDPTGGIARSYKYGSDVRPGGILAGVAKPGSPPDEGPEATPPNAPSIPNTTIQRPPPVPAARSDIKDDNVS